MLISRVYGWDPYHAQLRMNINRTFCAGFNQQGVQPVGIVLLMSYHPVPLSGLHCQDPLFMLRPRLPQVLGCSTLCVPRLLVWIY